jgi:hypothetical protein
VKTLPPEGPMTEQSWSELEAHFRASHDPRALLAIDFVRGWRAMSGRQDEPLHPEEWLNISGQDFPPLTTSDSAESAPKSPPRRGWWARLCAILGRR